MLYRIIGAVLLLCSISTYANTDTAVTYLTSPKTYKVSEEQLWRKANTPAAPNTLAELKTLYLKSPDERQKLANQMGGFVGKLEIKQLSSQQNWFLVPNIAYLDHGIIFFEAKDGSVTPLGHFGRKDPLTENQKLFNQAIKFKLTANQRGALWFYVEAQNFSHAGHLSIVPASEYISDYAVDSFIIQLSLGVLFCLSLLTLIAFLKWHDEKSILFYSLFVGTMAIAWLFASGIFDIWLNSVVINYSHWGVYLYTLALAFAIQFTRYFFNYPQLNSSIDGPLRTLAITIGLMAIIQPLLPFQVAFALIHIFTIIYLGVAITIAIKHAKQGQMRARYFLAGQITHSTALIYLMLTHAGILPSGQLSQKWALVALALDAFIISIAVGGTIKKFQLAFHSTEDLARTDPLTQVGNRFSLNERVQGLNSGYAIALFDVDHLKKINRKFGHDRGDQLLITATNLMKKYTQDLGSLYRYGGDEIVLLMVEQGQDVQRLTEHLKSRINKIEQELKLEFFAYAGISYGVSHSFEALTFEQCAKIAEQRILKDQEKRKPNLVHEQSKALS